MADKCKASKVPRMRRGRPTLLTPAISAVICDQLLDGRSMRDVCEDPGMPGRRTLCRWLEQNTEFRHQVARAREAYSDFRAEEELALACAATPETAHAARLRFDAARWWLGKIAPKKYGERTAHEVSGPDGGAIQLQRLPPLTPPEVTAALGKLIGKIEKDSGLPVGRGSHKKRLEAALGAGGRFMHPDVYAARYGAAGKKDGADG